MTVTGQPTLRRTPTVGAARVAGGLVAAIVLASIFDMIIALVAHAAGVTDFRPLTPPAYLSLTTFGILGATVGWAAIRRLVPRPAPLLRRLVPAVLLLSFVPDIAILLTGSMNATAGGVAALMVMHVAVAAVVVTMLLRALPVR